MKFRMVKQPFSRMYQYASDSAAISMCMPLSRAPIQARPPLLLPALPHLVQDADHKRRTERHLHKRHHDAEDAPGPVRPRPVGPYYLDREDHPLPHNESTADHETQRCEEHDERPDER